VHRIAFVISPGFHTMSLAALSVFEMANFVADEPAYELRVLSDKGGAIASSLGVLLDTAPIDAEPCDTALFGGGIERAEAPPSVLGFARHALHAARRIAAICTGAYVLAQAGVLDGRQVTTHWGAARDLQARYPNLKVDEDRIFIIDGPVWTSAGGSAAIDLALGMVEEDLGRDVARVVAKQLVVYHRRAGGQSQHSALLEMDAKSDRIQSALDFARRNLHRPLGVNDLAEAAHLSPRQFSRAFRAETGQSPAKAIETLRVEAARIMMEQTRHPIEGIAEQTGFADRERMRRAFLRAFGQPPQTIRRFAQAA
jgi:transcriptional regulator GlxA family with amidase domain